MRSGTPRRRQAAATSATGCRVPSSFEARIRHTRRVSASTASIIAAAGTTPSPAGGTSTTRMPRAASRAAPARTEGCSRDDSTSPPRWPESSPTAASTVRLASVPEAVSTTSSRRAPMSAATSSRDSSIARRASRPGRWAEDGLPCQSSHETTASRTSGRSGVVALWSK